MKEADIVVSSTGSSQTILQAAQIDRVMAARRNRPLFMIDIAVPRDIDPDVQHLDNVYLYNIDHLEALVGENLQMREAELARCREIIEEKTSALMTRLLASSGRKPGRPGGVSQPGWLSGSPALCPA
jgi:glutamyl-tRNA reductase